MLRISLVLLICFLSSTVVQSQKEDLTWILNNSSPCAGHPFPEICGATIVDFSNNIPEFSQDQSASLDFRITNASLSSKTGQLIAYTNGLSIHGIDHIPILDGDTISYGPAWDGSVLSAGEPIGFDIGTGAVFISKPATENEYYLLYTNYDGVDTTSFLNKRYAHISVEEDGSARVISKDVVFADTINSVGQLTCAQHAIGRDWWLIQNRDDTLMTYLIDPLGINLNHKMYTPNSWAIFANGISSFNSTGDIFAVHHLVEATDSFGNEIVVADFDRCTGLLSNIKTRRWNSLNTSILGPSLAFSPSGQYLYVGDAMQLIQYDVWQEDVFSTETIVAEYDGFVTYLPGNLVERETYFSRFQLGPNGKIYIPSAGGNFYLGIIHQPDLKGIECRVEQHAIRLPTFVYGTTLTFPTLRLGPIDGSSCDTLGLDNNPVARFRYEQDTLDFLDIDFVDLSFFEPTRWEWDFGDGNTSTERVPSHRYAADGAYRVCLTVSNDNSADVSCDTLYLGVSSLSTTEDPRLISLFPNPVEDQVRVAFHDYLPRQASISIYNIRGKLVQTSMLPTTSQLIDLNSLPSGVYLYEVRDGTEILKKGKVVKI